jgi:hypothetical protein
MKYSISLTVSKTFFEGGFPYIAFESDGETRLKVPYKINFPSIVLSLAAISITIIYRVEYTYYRYIIKCSNYFAF